MKLEEYFWAERYAPVEKLLKEDALKKFRSPERISAPECRLRETMKMKRDAFMKSYEAREGRRLHAVGRAL